MDIALDTPIDVKFVVSTSTGTRIRTPGVIQVTDSRIEFLKSPFSLKDEIKSMQGAKWHGFQDPPRKIWSVDNCPRNWFSLQVLFGENPYTWFDRPLEVHEYSRPLYKHQRHMTDGGLTYHYQIWGVEMGCIDGDAIVPVNRAGKGFSLSLRDLCYKFHGGLSRGHAWDQSIDTTIQGFRGDKIGLTKIKDVLFKGTKTTVILKTENQTLRLTPDHEVCIDSTGCGTFVRADELTTDDAVMVRIPKNEGATNTTRVEQTPPAKLTKIASGGLEFSDTKKPDKDGYLRVFGLKNQHPRYSTHGVYEHILVAEEFLGISIPLGAEVHHINGQRWDNRPENLRYCENRAQHMQDHPRQYNNLGCGQYTFERVISIQDGGETDVYDVVCEGPYHNFVANDMVVHNCGKTLSAIEQMEMSGVKDWWWVGPRSGLYAVEREFKRWEVAADIGIEVMTYEGLTKRMKTWHDGDAPPQGIVFDESSRLKSPKSQRSQAAQAIADGIREHHGLQGYVTLMSGTPSPKSPLDWWKPAEICYPGFLKEGNPMAFKLRLGICQKQENRVTGQTFLQHVTWRDSEKKCDICGEKKGHDNHVTSLKMCTEDLHKFVPSKNEVSYLYKRLQGLVLIKHKKDCLDLPEKMYRIIQCEPTPALCRVAQALVKSAPSTITGLTWLRELSDGFQYRTKVIGKQPCPVCAGEGTVEYWVDPDDEDKAFSMTDMLNPDYADTLVKQTLTCMTCGGDGEVDKFERIVKEIPCPKDAALVDLLGENEEQGRVVIFAGFTGSIDKVTHTCQKEGWDVVRVDGRGWIVYAADGTPIKVDPLEYWANMEDHSKVAFVSHPKSGGMGLTLIEARMAIYYSNSYESESRIQSEDRIHRIGMDENRGATIVDLVHLPTDEQVLERLKSNRRLELMTLGEVGNAFTDM